MLLGNDIRTEFPTEAPPFDDMLHGPKMVDDAALNTIPSIHCELK